MGQQLYDAALLTRCYSQHALRPFTDTEAIHERHFVKTPFINFINLPSIFNDRYITSPRPDYFGNREPQLFVINIARP